MKRYKGRIFCNCIMIIMTIIMMSMSLYAAESIGFLQGKTLYDKGDETKVYAQFYGQQNGGGWSWYATGSKKLTYGEPNTLVFSTIKDDGTSIFANMTAKDLFGIQFIDYNLSEGDSSSFKTTIEEVVIQAEGYDDLVIILDPCEYVANYTAKKSSWGLTNQSTNVSLKEYITEDFGKYIKSITSLQMTIRFDNYKYKAKNTETEFPEGYTYPTEMRGLTAEEIVSDMQLGWNLGNTLDAIGGETAWGNPETTRAMIDAVKEAGFNTIRIPVTWDNGTDDEDDFRITEKWLDRVETIVNYAMVNDMYAIINVHHSSNGWFFTTPELKESAAYHYKRLWEQISERFKDYGDKLIFETMNEPRNGESDWNGDATGYDIVNYYNQVCLETIRESGGNNTERLVMLPLYAAGTNVAAANAFKELNDDMIAASVHAYSPYNFAMNASNTGTTAWGSDADKRELAHMFNNLDEIFLSNGIPVVLGEFASTHKDNVEERAKHAKYYAQLAKKYSIPCIWWDNGISEAYKSDAMALLDRRNIEWIYPEIVEALMEGYYSGEDVELPDFSIIFEGVATSKNWGQALAFLTGVDIILDDFKAGDRIAVVYESTKKPEFILQSWSGGPKWVKVSPSEVIDGVAYFSYEKIIKTYAAAMSNYESYDEPLPLVDKVYIGDDGVPLTVTKVYFD